MDRCALKNYDGFCRELMIIFRNWASKCLGRLVTGFCCFYLFVNAIAPLSSGGRGADSGHSLLHQVPEMIKMIIDDDRERKTNSILALIACLLQFANRIRIDK